MAIKFNNVEGSAKKSSIKYMSLADGKNRFRMVGDVLPRYIYWVNNGKATASFECLAFDRDLEKFTNAEHDFVPELVEKYQGTARKEVRCSWAYAVQVIDRADGKLKVLNLKKKMFEGIKQVAQDLGDPTDPETGYDIIVERAKTGPHAYNVEYSVKQIAIMKEKNNPLPEEDAEIIANLKSIEEVIPRPSPAEVKKTLEAFLSRANEEEEGSSDSDAESIDELS